MAAPDTPTLTVSDVRVDAADLEGSAYSDPDGDAHQDSRWRVYPEGESTAAYDSGWITTDLESHVVPAGSLSADTKYEGTVEYRDGTGTSSGESARRFFRTSPDLGSGVEGRETQADFETGTERLDGASTTRRPDAVSLDYLRSFSLGPVELQDPSDGVFDFAWYVRVDNAAGEVYVARENDARSDWRSETLLFSFSGADIEEIDLAFDANGNTVVAAERSTGASGAPELWIRFFDAGANAFTFTNFGAGRNPKAILDDPDFLQDADVLVFYVSPSSASDAIAWRKQGENYGTEHLSPVTGASDLHMEEVGKSVENRVQLAYVDRDPSAGTMALKHLASALYPVIADDEAVEATHEIVGTPTVTLVILEASNQPAEGAEVTHEVIGTPVIDAVINAVFSEGDTGSFSGFDTGIRTEDEAAEATHEVVGTPVVDAVVLAIFSEGDAGSVSGHDTGVRTQDEAVEAAHEVIGTPTVTVVIIEALNQPDEAVEASHEVVGTPTVTTV